MKKLLFSFLILLLSLSSVWAQNQQKPTKKASKKPEPVVAPEPKLVKMPMSSTDCNFAIELNADTIIESIAPPKGPGFLIEIKKDVQNSELFDTEHNIIWYKLKAPYSSKLLLSITPSDSTDDYDFLLYNGTDPYFCNKVLNKKIKPVRSNLSAPNPENGGIIGISLKGKDHIITKKSKESYTQTVDIKKGEIYYLVLDNASQNPKPYTLQLVYHVSGKKPLLRVLDGKTRKTISADVLLTEENAEKSVAVDKRDVKSTFIVFEANTNYALNVKKEGYFSYKERFNSSKYAEDSVITVRLHPIVVGAKYSLKDIYFEDGLTELLPESESALMVIVDMLNEHPNLHINIQGFINTDGYNVEEDMKVTEGRAVSVKIFFEKQGISSARMTSEGMSKKELTEKAELAISGNSAKLIDKKVEITITKIDDNQ